jgi:hypothetical protein
VAATVTNRKGAVLVSGALSSEAAPGMAPSLTTHHDWSTTNG